MHKFNPIAEVGDGMHVVDAVVVRDVVLVRGGRVGEGEAP